jgi:hypothetical protein
VAFSSLLGTKLVNQFSHLKFRLWQKHAEAFLWNYDGSNHSA